jgi:hypothetical protein
MNYFGMMGTARPNAGGSAEIYLDDLTFTSLNQIPAIPEPASLGLMAMGGFGLVRRRSR